ncbi:ATP-binding protein [Pedobacter terrae]
MQHTYPGLGLGLYISAEIIKNEGGRIWVNSAVGEGATFFFALKII